MHDGTNRNISTTTLRNNYRLAQEFTNQKFFTYGFSQKSNRKTIHEDLENGETHILIGTHALLEDKVKFKNLGFVVIDEQHRFGVTQRAKMWLKKHQASTHISNDSYTNTKNPSYDTLR